MRKNFLFLLATAGFALAMSQSTWAAIIVDYDMDNEPGNQTSNTASIVDPNVTALLLQRGTGLAASSALDSISSSAWDDMSANDYLTFGFTVNAGYQANLGLVTFSSRSSGTGPGNLAIRTSLDGYTANVATFSQVGTANTSNSFDFSSLGTITGNLEFRIYAANNADATPPGNIASGGTFRVGTSSGTNPDTHLIVNGTVTPVPEPASALLFATALAMGAFRRRR